MVCQPPQHDWLHLQCFCLLFFLFVCLFELDHNVSLKNTSSCHSHSSRHENLKRTEIILWSSAVVNKEPSTSTLRHPRMRRGQRTPPTPPSMSLHFVSMRLKLKTEDKTLTKDFFPSVLCHLLDLQSVFHNSQRRSEDDGDEEEEEHRVHSEDKVSPSHTHTHKHC